MIDSDMKKITNLLYMLAVLLLASCSDFLDKSPKNTVDPETMVTDDVAIALTNACYRTLQSSNMYNQRIWTLDIVCLLYTSPSPRDAHESRMPSSA